MEFSFSRATEEDKVFVWDAFKVSLTRGDAFVAKVGKEIAGYSWFVNGELINFIIHPNYQGKGFVAKKFLDYSLREWFSAKKKRRLAFLSAFSIETLLKKSSRIRLVEKNRRLNKWYQSLGGYHVPNSKGCFVFFRPIGKEPFISARDRMISRGAKIEFVERTSLNSLSVRKPRLFFEAPPPRTKPAPRVSFRPR